MPQSCTCSVGGVFVWVNVTISSCSALARQRRGFSHNLFFPQSAQEPHQSPASGWWRQSSSSSSSSSSSWRPCLWIWTATRQFLDNWTLNSRCLLTRMWNCLCLWNSRLKPQQQWQQFTFHSYKLSLAISNAGVWEEFKAFLKIYSRIYFALDTKTIEKMSILEHSIYVHIWSTLIFKGSD